MGVWGLWLARLGRQSNSDCLFYFLRGSGGTNFRPTPVYFQDLRLIQNGVLDENDATANCLCVPFGGVGWFADAGRRKRGKVYVRARVSAPCLLKPENHKTQTRKEIRRVQLSACTP